MKHARDDTRDRVFFITKSWLLGQIAGVVFLLVVFVLGSINFWQVLVLNIFLFVFSLLVGRYFERQINRTVSWIDSKLERFPRIKSLVKNHL